MFFTKDDQKDEIAANVDDYGDSYARSTTIEELKEVSNSL
jgi:DNA ligase-4